MKMPPRLLVTVPSLILVAAVLGARVSGNDKSPFLVLAVLALMVIFCLGALAVALRGGLAGRRAMWLCLGTFLPLLYAVVVVVLARRHVIDSMNWLGFR